METEHPGCLGSQDTFYVGTIKGVRHIYQQTFIDTYSRVAIVKLYESKTVLTAANLLNDQVLPFFESQQVPLLRILTNRGSEYCGNVEYHECQLYLAIKDIGHTRTKTKSPQTNGMCERFHRAILKEFYQIPFCKKLYTSVEQLQHDVDDWIDSLHPIPFRPLLLWQDPDANLPLQQTLSEDGASTLENTIEKEHKSVKQHVEESTTNQIPLTPITSVR